MNPFNNRWLALFIVVVFLLIVTELVGTDDRSGILSQAASSSYGPAGEGSRSPSGDIPIVSEDTEASETPPEEQPQIVSADDGDDPYVDGPEDASFDDGADVEPSETDSDPPADDGPGDFDNFEGDY